MKKELLMAALAAVSSVCLMAQTDPYVVEIEDAVWNFDDYSDTKTEVQLGSAKSEYIFCCKRRKDIGKETLWMIGGE